MRTGCLSIVGLLGLLGLAAPARADDTPPHGELDPETIQAAAEEARFSEYVQRGDRARASGQMADAVIAYSDALKVRADPLIAGRLGVLLVKAGRPAKGADLLHDAVNRDWRAGPAEREQFKAAYDAARAVVCMLDVTISHIPERTTLDGEPINPKHRTGFFIFAMPGEHELRASLTGYRDGRAGFTACKGGSLDVPVTLTPLPSDPPPQEPAAIPAPRGLPEMRVEPLGNSRLGIAGAVAVVDGKPLPKQEDPYAYDDSPGGDGKKSGVRGSVGVGPVMVLGVASWAPAFGAVLTGSLQPAKPVSLTLEARAAWLTTGVGGQPGIRAMTIGGLAGVCGHWRWLFGCLMGHIGAITIDYGVGFVQRSDTFVKPGIGGRMGVAVPIVDAFEMKMTANAIGLSSGVGVKVEQTVVVEQAPVLIDASIVGSWRF